MGISLDHKQHSLSGPFDEHCPLCLQCSDWLDEIPRRVFEEKSKSNLHRNSPLLGENPSLVSSLDPAGPLEISGVLSGSLCRHDLPSL